MATHRMAASGLVLAFIPAVVTPAVAIEDPVVTIYMDNRAHAPARLLASARAEIEDVFRAAGVDIVWSRRPVSRSHVSAGGPSREVTVMLATMQSPCVGTGCTLGVAVSRRMTTFVFVNRVLAAAREHPIDPGTVLGRVIAHEIGHLLLPPGPHATYGLMRREIEFGFETPSRFSDEEARIIREGLTLSARR